MPPVAETVTDVVPPLQAIVPGVAETTTCDGCEIVIVTEAEHPFASVTV